MLIKDFQLIQLHRQKQYNISKKEKNHIEHLLYKKMQHILTNKQVSSFCFCHMYDDDFQVWPTIDDLIKKQKTVYISEIKNNKLIFNKIEDVYNKFNYLDGYLKYSDKKYVEEIDMFIFPVQIYKNKEGIVFNDVITSFLQEYNGIKLAYSLKNNYVDDLENIDKKIIINFDEIIEL